MSYDRCAGPASHPARERPPGQVPLVPKYPAASHVVVDRTRCIWLVALSLVAVVFFLTLCRPTLGCFFLPTHIPPIPTTQYHALHTTSPPCRLEHTTLPSTANTRQPPALPHASPVFTSRPLGTSPANQHPSQIQIPRERSTSSILGRLRPRPKYNIDYNTLQAIGTSAFDRVIKITGTVYRSNCAQGTLFPVYFASPTIHPALRNTPSTPRPMEPTKPETQHKHT